LRAWKAVLSDDQCDCYTVKVVVFCETAL